jgi:hypothetical protein
VNGEDFPILKELERINKVAIVTGIVACLLWRTSRRNKHVSTCLFLHFFKIKQKTPENRAYYLSRIIELENYENNSLHHHVTALHRHRSNELQIERTATQGASV